MAAEYIRVTLSGNSKVYEITRIYLENTIDFKNISAVEFAEKFVETFEAIENNFSEKRKAGWY